MTTRKIRVLIVDDTALYRKIIRDVLSDFPEIDVVGTAPNGKIALSKLETLKPDLLTLDQEMPEMDGLETLRQIKEKHLKVATIMVSAFTTRGASITMQALNLGAFDFIAKPDSKNIQENINSLKEQFEPQFKAFAKRLEISTGSVRVSVGTSTDKAIIPELKLLSGLKGKPKIVTIGISTGGPKALADVIPNIPGDLGVPVVLVQHMPPVFTKALAESLDKKSPLTIVEGQNGQILQANTVYIAPGGKQMKVVSGSGIGQYVIKITDDPPENHCKPSADYLFRSVSSLFPGKALAVIMTGMGRDGTTGLRLLKREGAKVIAQDEQSCVVFGMPMEAIKAGVVDQVVSLDQIAAKITSSVRGI